MTAPDMVSIIAAALEDHSEVELEQRVWTCICGHEFGLITDDTCPAVDHREHQARAVLAAISEAGTVEWGVEYADKSPRSVTGSIEVATAAAERFDGTVVTRLTFPWTTAVSWGVSYKGKVYPYESEDEARRQLFLAQMDVPAVLATKVGDGEWVEVEG